VLIAVFCVLGAFLSRHTEAAAGTAFGATFRDARARPKKAGLAASKKGFGAPAAPRGFDVPEPAGGWPTISVLVLSSDSKTASSNALRLLGEQDYPADRIQEVIVSGQSELMAAAPKSLKSVLKEFSSREPALNLAAELAACTGDVVAIWGDDHVSSAHRLKTQVAAAMSGSSKSSVLQPSWFFDPDDSDFMKVRTWPIKEFEEFLTMSGGETAPPPKSMARMMVCADPLTLCGKRSDLLEASSGVEPSASPSEGLKDLLAQLVNAAKEPELLEDFAWAAVRAPPAATRFESTLPERVLSDLAKAAFPKEAKGTDGKKELEEAVKEIQQVKPSPGDAIFSLLEIRSKKPATGFDLKRVRKAILERMNAGGAPQVLEAIEALAEWDGLKPGKGGAQAARDLPVYFACFQALRDAVAENADFWDIKALAKVAEDLVKLGMKVWATDSEVNEALAKQLAQELYRANIEEMATDRALKTADIAGTLGLRPPLEAVAFAALDLPDSGMTASSLASLAWALAEGGVENASLQLKVAKGLINRATTMTPPDIGNAFIALHDRQWFKDKDSIAYLTEALMGQVRNLKQSDPGLRAILAQSLAGNAPSELPA